MLGLDLHGQTATMKNKNGVFLIMYILRTYNQTIKPTTYVKIAWTVLFKTLISVDNQNVKIRYYFKLSYGFPFGERAKQSYSK